jgi:DNA polymerase-3 subunit delta
VIYLFHGPDAFSIGEAVAGLKARLFAEDAFAELNHSELDGRRLSVAELRAVADALPFMGARRLVVVHNLLARCNPQGGEAGRAALADALKAYLPELPEATRLVFVDGALHGNNPILRWAEARRAAQVGTEEALVVRAFAAPAADRLPGWLAARAGQKGGQITPGAAAALAEALDREGTVDLRLADGELEKLLTYAGDRPVGEADVALLVTPVSLEKVFALTEALADRDGRRASTLLRGFLDHGEAPLRLQALVARQFRQLAAARTLLDAGTPPGELAAGLGVAPFVAKKLAGQARRFNAAFLQRALAQLAQQEQAAKTGQIDAGLALELFVAEVSRGPGTPAS